MTTKEFIELLNNLTEEISHEIKDSSDKDFLKQKEVVNMLSSYANKPFTDSEKKLLAIIKHRNRYYYQLTQRLFVKLFERGFIRDTK